MARYLKYLEARAGADREPQGVGVLRRRRDGRARVARRQSDWPRGEKLDNLIFVVNCNLQRLDGPVSGQRQDHPGAEANSAGRAGRDQGDLGLVLGPAAREDKDGILLRVMEETVDASTRTTRRTTAHSCAAFLGKHPSSSRWLPT